MINAHRLADTVARRLSPTIPAPLSVQARAGSVEVLWDRELLGATVVESLVNQGLSVEVEARLAADAILSNVQDLLVRSLSNMWPDPGPSHQLPIAGTKVSDDMLYLWYGEERSPSLALPSIALAEFAGPIPAEGENTTD
jgi:hypothetical protein